VKIYLFRLFHKLDVRNRFELARCGAIDQMPASPTQQVTRTAPPSSRLPDTTRRRPVDPQSMRMT
jgi:hypothetical protein